MLEQKPAKNEPSLGINTNRNIPSTFPGGAPTVLPEGQIAITGIRTGSSAAAAGLDIGDVLVALNGEQVTATNFADLLKAQKIGDEIPVTVFRRSVLKTFQVKVDADKTLAYAIKEIPNPDESQKKTLTSWLGDAR
jgi:predicted metalloprotease with PDZ domain